MKCSICGGQISGREEICPTCGMRSTPAVPPREPVKVDIVGPERPPKKRINLGKTILIIIEWIVVILAVFVLFHLQTDFGALNWFFAIDVIAAVFIIIFWVYLWFRACMDGDGRLFLDDINPVGELMYEMRIAKIKNEEAKFVDSSQIQKQAAETRRKCNEYAKTAPETPDFSVNSDKMLTAVLQELYNAAALEGQINALAEELKEEEAK